LRKVTIRFVMSFALLSVYLSVRMRQLGSHWTDFMKFDIRAFFEKVSRKCKFQWSRIRITGNADEHQYTFFIISRSLLLGMRNVADDFVEKIKMRFLRSITPFENRDVYEITWKNIVESDRPQMTICPILSSHWIPKAINTHCKYVIPIAFILQQWLHERSQCKFIRAMPVFFV
jgi:hypothetical protein